MWIRNSIFILLAALLLSSCSESQNKSSNSTGRGSEIIVIGHKPVWDGPVGDAIRRVLTCNMPGLPEAEPEFTLIFIPEKNFSKFLQTHRNILIIDIRPGYRNSKVETISNEWSHPQRVIKVKAGSDTALINIFTRHSEAIRELFNQNERARFTAQNALSQNLLVEKLLAEEFGIKMVIAKDFYQAKKKSDFIWLRSETTANSLGLMIYTYPYKDTAQLNPATVLVVRDRYTKLYIPGPLEGSFMKLERDYYPPVSRKILFKKMYALETRGLWKTEGDFMGGPFVNYTIVDAPRQRIIVFDGYIYYPNKSKRNYIRQLESIIWGAEIGEQEKVKPKQK
jgi:hypothetical protein